MRQKLNGMGSRSWDLSEETWTDPVIVYQATESWLNAKPEGDQLAGDMYIYTHPSL